MRWISKNVLLKRAAAIIAFIAVILCPSLAGDGSLASSLMGQTNEPSGELYYYFPGQAVDLVMDSSGDDFRFYHLRLDFQRSFALLNVNNPACSLYARQLKANSQNNSVDSAGTIPFRLRT